MHGEEPLVTESVPEWSSVAGVPARIIGRVSVSGDGIVWLEYDTR